MPEVLNTGLTMVGEGSTIPEGLVIGRNVVIHPDSNEKTFGKKFTQDVIDANLAAVTRAYEEVQVA